MELMTVAILGNHAATHSTESELACTFEHLGHQVLRFQENTARTENILRCCLDEKAALLIYVHSHAWSTPGALTVDELIGTLQDHGVKTAAFHLDLFWGLKNDDREKDIGHHPLWKCQWVFTADGGHDAGFAERGVNHHWLPPAVAERGCFDGNYRAEYEVDVAFVGSRAYHPEYRFRGQLIAWLERTYGNRFRHVPGGLREQRLNDFYASVKVLVGDCCFSGIPRYWSDRVFETIGRGGFIVHPQVQGLEVPGLVTFTPRDMDDLKSKIDYYLDPAHQQERIRRRDQATAWVRANETYTQRVQTMLGVMGFKEAHA